MEVLVESKMIPEDRVYKREREESKRHFLRPYLNDPIIVDILEKIKTRADKGMRKYGVPMTREDIDTLGWLRYAQEEALDMAVYLERLIRDFERNHKL